MTDTKNKNNTLYCFVSHNDKIIEDTITIKNMMDKLSYNDYIIVYGGEKQHIQDDHVVYLDCDDSYCGLPEKINLMFKYVFSVDRYDYAIKLDRTTTIKKLLPNHFPAEYMGHIYMYILNKPKTGKNHFGKCHENHKWYNKKFEGGEGILYCSGVAYILGKVPISIVASDDTLYKNNIYEDYYVGFLLRSKNIKPSALKLKDFFYDVEHPGIFNNE